jgi:hypothetical protein
MKIIVSVSNQGITITITRTTTSMITATIETKRYLKTKKYFKSTSIKTILVNPLTRKMIINEDSQIVESENKVSITSHLISVFPEDWQADLESQQERWIKRNYSSRKIKYLILKHLLHMVWVYIQIQIENIWLPKSSSTK